MFEIVTCRCKKRTGNKKRKHEGAEDLDAEIHQELIFMAWRGPFDGNREKEEIMRPGTQFANNIRAENCENSWEA